MGSSVSADNGDGTGAEMTGILNNANIQGQAGAGTDIDEVAAATTKLRTVGFTEPDAVVHHPDDWSSSELGEREGRV